LRKAWARREAGPMLVTLEFFPLASMLALLFAAVWIREGQR
jgi:hypothetical protein